ncbi:MAG: hypothetical protein PCFJNLEI_03189 [Verrucomicrobiae bacterium]|nr:hypothetical protein [Verrucomicrobiae bacterium]
MVGAAILRGILRYWGYGLGYLVIFLTPTPALVCAQNLQDPTLGVVEAASGFSLPIGMEFLATNDFLVIEKNSGQVRRVIAGVIQPQPALVLDVDTANERGLLGIVKHPGFATNNFIYLCHTPSAGNCVCIQRYTWNGSALVDPTDIFSFPTFTGISNHQGGVMTFGPDGKLYAVTGDHGQFGPLQNQPTGPLDDTSVIVRLNDDGSIPADNPLAVAAGDAVKYYAYGIRNSFGMAFDPLSGELWNTENGAQAYDEINRVLPGFNSGWREIMGPAARNPSGTNNLVNLTGGQYADPVFSWLETVAPTGLVFLNSTALGSAYENDLFVGDFNNGYLYHFDLNAQRDALALTGGLSDTVADNANELDSVVLGTGFDGISSLKVGPDGKLYVVSLFQGKIYAVTEVSGSDLAITRLKAPKKIKLPVRPKTVTVTLQNRGPANVTFSNLSTLTNLIQIQIESLGDCPTPTATIVPPKKLPVTLAPERKITLRYTVTFDCANDAGSGSGREDYRFTARINPYDDPNSANNECPRPPVSVDKGCNKGRLVLTDVHQQ